MFLEHGIGQREKILKIFSNHNFTIDVYDDLSKIDRAIAVQNKG